MARKGGPRRSKRSLFSKGVKQKGKISLRRYLQEFSVGDKVLLALEPSIHKGTFFPRFAGKGGVVTKKVGSCYEVQIKDFDKTKIVVVHPVHLKKQKEN